MRYFHKARGHLEKLQDAVSVADAGGTFTPQAVYRKVTAMDTRGNVTGETLGNGVARRHGFDGRTGRLLSIRSGRLSADDRQDLAYDWDALGNLKSRTRTQNGNALAETFTCDGLKVKKVKLPFWRRMTVYLLSHEEWTKEQFHKASPSPGAQKPA